MAKKSTVPSDSTATPRKRVSKAHLRIVSDGNGNQRLVRAKTDKAAVAHVVGTWFSRRAEVEEAAKLIASGVAIEDAGVKESAA